jgi:hypothetical protein
MPEGKKEYGHGYRLLLEQFKVFKSYFMKICELNHLVKSPTLKFFLDKKSDLKQSM